MYKVFNGKTWYTFDYYSDLVNYLSAYNRFVGTTFYNSFFDNVAGNDNDTMVVYNGHYGLYPYDVKNRTFKIVNDFGANFYSKLLIDDVRKWEYDDSMYKVWANKHIYNNKSYRYIHGVLRNIDIDYPEFRRGPWPYVASHHRYKAIRHIRTTQEKRQSMDEDSKELVRAKRGMNLPSCWDDHIRDWRNSGWKRQGKNQHQWELGVKNKSNHNYGKHIYVDNTIRDKYCICEELEELE